MKPFDIHTFQPSSGITLIEASAGTGKTHSITAIVTELVASGQCKIDEVLVLTFTNAATAELKERVRRELYKANQSAESAGDAQRCSNLAYAIDAFDNAAIQTIHGFCQRTLHEFSLECGLSVEFEVIKDTEEFDLKVKAAIIRRIQRESVAHPELIPFCSLIGFEENFIGKILKNRQTQSDLGTLDPKLQSGGEALEITLEELRQAWQSEREDIRASLLHPKENPVGKKGKYIAKEIEKAFRCFDRWVDQRKMDSELFNRLGYYGVSKLESNLKKNATLPPFRFFELCETVASQMDSLLFKVLQIIHEEVTLALEGLNERQQRLRYDDLLNRLQQTLGVNPSLVAQLRQRFRFGLIDEFQDTDPVQFEILERIFIRPIEQSEVESVPARPLILIGDPKQAIYGFRGGDIFTYLKAKQLSEEQYYLTTNWRSAPEINAGMNTLLSHADQAPFVFPWLGYEPVQTAPKHHNKALILRDKRSGKISQQSGVHFRELPNSRFSNQYQVYRQLVKDIRELLHGTYRLLPGGEEPEHPVRQSDIAILVHSNVQGAAIRKELARAGIQATQSGGSSVMDTDEARDWYRILLGMLSPRHPQQLRSAISTAPFAYSSSDLRSLETDYSRWSDILSAFGQAHEYWVHGRFAQAIGLLKTRFNWIENLSQSADPLRTLTNHTHILELLLAAQDEASLQPSELIKWFRQKIQSPQSNEETEVLRLERDAQSVSIMTMHKSKGLQFPIVFLPFPPTEKGPKDFNLPYSIHDSEGDRTCFYAESQINEEIRQKRQQEMLSERLRLSYVAITRAEYQCTVYVTDGKNPPALNRWNTETAGDTAYAQVASRVGSFLWSRLDTEETEDSVEAQEDSRKTTLVEPPHPPESPPGVVQWSFTGMIQHQADSTEPGTDELPIIPIRSVDESETTITEDIHSFEKGTHAGLFFHALLQYIDFRHPGTWQGIAEATLTRYGYNPEPWIVPVVGMLESLASTAFRDTKGDTVIGSVETQQLFRETEFTFPLRFNSSTYRELKKAVEDWQQTIGNTYTLPEVESAQAVLEGYMKGVVDAWFEVDGKIYLVDWKSNWLGTSIEAYTESALIEAMNDHHYHLQYLLYTCALMKYLKLIRPGFDYERDFAGAYYVFVRGLTPGSEPKGVYHAKPPQAIVESMSRCFQS